MILRQKLWLAFVLTTNLLLWIIPSNVVELIARDRQTILGRYSLTHFTWNAGVALVSLVSFYIDWSTGPTYKRRWFQVFASLMVLVPLLIVADFLMRSPQQQHYVRDTIAYHRPVNAEFSLAFEDKPKAYRTYPDAPAGFGVVPCTLHTDGRGYRNSSALQHSDVVVVGDSFAEGSNVSDEHTWPRRLAEAGGRSVYNLGMSGYDPMHYLASLKEIGLQLNPRIVICQLYEGNDFRSAKADRKRLRPSLSKRFLDYVDRSPVKQNLVNLMTEALAPIGANRPIKGVGVLHWLPLRIPDCEAGKYYTFEPKQLRDMYENADQFARDRHWSNCRDQLNELNRLCGDAGCRLAVLFAPTKAHVTLPLVAAHLPAADVFAFMKMSYKGALPAPAALVTNLVERADAREEVVRQWCEQQSIPFMSLTEALRSAVLAGRQVYYTYDQHWSPEGHAVVAAAVQDFLEVQFQLGTRSAQAQ